jgi:hypothetical protein
MAGYSKLGIDMVIVIPPASGQADWIDKVAAPVAARLAEL